jgi:Rrf2 family transcriptional regulator, nitric oxide-sensitive transcriptional repressor
MNKLNRKLEYSLMALKHMSLKNPGDLTTAKEVSESYQAPFDATARVMQMMAGHGLLKSEQGALGGYQITQDLSKLNLHELIEVIQGPTKIAKCLQHGDAGGCEIKKSCNIISPVVALNQRLTDFYKSVSVRELLARD